MKDRGLWLLRRAQKFSGPFGRARDAPDGRDQIQQPLAGKDGRRPVLINGRLEKGQDKVRMKRPMKDREL
jgi:hypothetical protein